MDAVITAGSNKTADDDDSSASTDPYALITAVTNKGHLYIYSHQLATFETPKLKKPIKSVYQIQIVTNEGNPLGIYGAIVLNKLYERLDSFVRLQTER